MERTGSEARRCRNSHGASATCWRHCAARWHGAPVAMPASIREIAAELVVTEAAVKQHLLNLYDKFDIPEGTESRRIALGSRGGPARLRVRGRRGARCVAGVRSETGRAAAARRAWGEAFAAPVAEPPGQAPLTSTTWSCSATPPPGRGSSTRRRPHREQAYAAYLALGDRRSAARVALGLGWNAAVTLRFSVVAGWMASAGRLLASDDGKGAAPVWPEHGLMLSLMALGELGAGKLDAGPRARPRGLRCRSPDR